jgi:hypothetical protein
MVHKSVENARRIFAFMVPVTAAAFLLGWVTTGSISLGQRENLIPTPYDVAGLAIGSIGIFLFNWYEEKPQKPSIEKIVDVAMQGI